MKEKINWKSLILWVVGTVAVGFFGGFIGGAMRGYDGINTPSFAPPDWVFSVVWSILYILMGVSAYLVFESDSVYKKPAIIIYIVQLVVNIIWPLLFFGYDMYTFAFIWLLILLALVIAMFVLFYRVKPLAAWLQIPYVLWLVFATVLNYYVTLLN